MSYFVSIFFFTMFRICCLFMIPTTHWTDVFRDFSPTTPRSLSCARTHGLETNILWRAFGSFSSKCSSLCLLTLKLICYFFTWGTFLLFIHCLRVSLFQNGLRISFSIICKMRCLKDISIEWTLLKLILAPHWALSLCSSSTSRLWVEFRKHVNLDGNITLRFFTNV